MDQEQAVPGRFSHDVKRNDVRMRRIPVAAASLLLVAGGLGGCALFDGLVGGDLSDALDLVPDDATAVTFRHRVAMAERLGVDDIAGDASPSEVGDYVEALAQERPLAGTDLAGYVTVMTEEAAFSELDVVWQVGASRPDAAPVAAYKVDSDLDLDAVGDDLADAGYDETELAGHRHFTVDLTGPAVGPDGLVGGRYPVTVLRELTLVPDEDLVLVGGADLVEVLDDDAESITDSGVFDDVLGEGDEAEYALLARDIDCSGQARLTPDVAEQLGELGSPDATAFYVSGDDAATTSALAFADDDAAQADLDAREAFLDGGVLLRTREPMSEVAEWQIERDGSLVRIDYTYDRPEMAGDAALFLDGFHVCNPE